MTARIFAGVLGLVFASKALGGPPIDLPPEAYLDPIDQEIARTGKPVGDRQSPCEIVLRSETKNGKTYHSDVTRTPTERCVRTTPVQRWSGLWRADFEGSQFCAASATKCDYVASDERKEPAVWLGIASDRDIDLSQADVGGLYAVEFEGRRTIFPGHYGHMGMFDAEIIIEKMISIKEVTPPPRPSRAEIEGLKNECLADRDCARDKVYLKALDDELKN